MKTDSPQEAKIRKIAQEITEFIKKNHQGADAAMVLSASMLFLGSFFRALKIPVKEALPLVEKILQQCWDY
jgi:hypoxanthine-guanine phosphoribosyltransferase